MAGSLLLKDKQAKILVMLKNVQQPWYLSSLSKACDTTYVHTSNFIKSCEKMGITTNDKHGKIKQIRLTEKGAQLAELLTSVYGIINQSSQPKLQQKPPEEQKPAAALPEKEKDKEKEEKKTEKK